MVLLLIVSVLWAQTETGQITGHAAIGSIVRATSVSTGALRETTTSATGLYTLSNLLPGEYAVSVVAPGVVTVSQEIQVRAGSRVSLDLAPSGLSLNLAILPNLTRNAYQFTELAGNISDAGMGNRGAGFALNGQRESSTNILLDGARNNNEYAGSVGQLIPLDAVEELSVLASGFPAEYGRASGGIVSLVGRRGGRDIHGTAYEFNRVSRLASNSFRDNAHGAAAPAFTRNQFGYAGGGPIAGEKLFFFSSTEWTRVRSQATQFAWVPDAQLIAQSATNTQAFFRNLGQLRPDARVTRGITLQDLTAIYGRNSCIGLACATLPTGLTLFDHVAWRAPIDAGAGSPQNTWNSYQRFDYNLSDHTQIYARYALYRETDQTGVLSTSPYADYDLGSSQFDHNFVASAIHTWTPRLTSQSKLVFSRLNIFQQGLTGRGVVPSMYANPVAPVTIGGDAIAFPGYNPFTPGSGGAFGGPQNMLELLHDVSWTKGSHAFRFGGSFDYMRDNRTDAAFQTAVGSLSTGGGIGPALTGLLGGRFAHIEVAVRPCGTTPGCSLSLPASTPDFSRSNRFHDGALYAQDFWKPRRRLAINLGVRWEHFGVQHNSNPNLDSNWYAPGIGFADDNLGTYLRAGGLQIASKSPVGGLWKPDWKDFAPRIGIAWDLFGNGTTTLRGGFGIGYERNFGNVTFNVIQNAPNYAVLDVPGPVTTNNFGPLADTGSIALPRSGARIINPNLKTAYADFWNAGVQHRFAPGVDYALEYSGSKGENLYSISYPNQFGFGNAALRDPCAGTGDCMSQPNANYSENVGYRGNQAFSVYHGLNNRLAMSDVLHSGLDLMVNYTWSHATDNLSSTFFEAGGQGIAGLYGSRNITTNNGAFVTGILDPYHPDLDRGNADFDIRHRVVSAAIWKVPGRTSAGRLSRLLSGWTLSSIVMVRSGQPFSVFDTNSQTLDLSAPRATFAGAVPHSRNTFIASTLPDTYHLFTFRPAQLVVLPNPLTPGAVFPADMSARNAFRAPGFWNVDFAIFKDTRITERFSLQLRAEAFNAFNHANLYVIGSSADMGSGNTVDGCFGCSGSTADRRHVQIAARLIF